MINFDKLEMVLFDFDNTLCIHTEQGDTDYVQFCSNVLLNREKAWLDCSPSPHMKKFMDICQKRYISMGLISAASEYFTMLYKAKYVLEHYGVALENFCVGKIELKVPMMKVISEAYNIEPGNMLIVDDYVPILDSAIDAGFQACSPMEVVNFVESLANKEIA